MMQFKNPIGKAELDKLRATAGGGPVLITTHDFPDPDALASGKALSVLLQKAWGVPSRLVYGGLVVRAENQAVLRRLTPEWEYADKMPDLEAYTAVAQVDTQPGAGNNRLDSVHSRHIVIDHHYPVRDMIDKVHYSDVRTELGSTATMLFQYLEAAGLEPDPILATALFYGLKTDTRGLSRDASRDDEVAFIELLHRLDQQELSKVELASLSRDYFRSLGRGLHATRLFGKVIVARLGPIEQPDFAAEMADILIRLQESHAALCLGQHGDTLHLSLRTGPKSKHAGRMIQQLIVKPGKAGGHRTLAGGQMPLEGRELDPLLDEIEGRFLKLMGESGEGVELID